MWAIASSLLLALAPLAAGGEGSVMKVELDIFSGRPNPSWHLTDSQEAELQRIIDDLPEDAGKRPPDPGLGYRGFVVTDGRRPSWRIEAFSGFVEVLGQDAARARSDPGRMLERWLLDSAGAELNTEIRRRVPLE